MKEWSIQYSIKFTNGKIDERELIIEAEDIIDAINYAQDHIRTPLLTANEVSDVVIWDVGIMDDDVF